MLRLLLPTLAGTLLALAATGVRADEPANTAPTWHTDYTRAWEEAKTKGQMLLIFFHGPASDRAAQAFEQKTLSDPAIQKQLSRYVLAKLPLGAQATAGGKPVQLIRHPAFAEMLGRQGVAVVDLKSTGKTHFGQVVFAYPFRPGSYLATSRLGIILDLPAGSLTQRTMIFAVRAHPEKPASTTGSQSPVLAGEAQSHSSHQASIGVQGHHNWDSRFQRINSRLPGGLLAQEVVAESWPGQSLVEAAEDCVHCWRQSPGHWEAVRGRHRLFGYDMKRGGNGIWYATGLFGIFNR
jgi:hypothetical protein